MSILVICNYSIRSTIIKAGLELSGYKQVQVCNIPAEAQNLVNSQSPLLIIYFHPDDDEAIQFCDIIHTDYHIPIMSIGNCSVETEVSLPFPYQFQDLLQSVQHFVPASFEVNLSPITPQEEEAKYRDLFDRASDAILLIDYDTHIIIDANDQAIILYGYSHDKLVGMSLLQLVPDEQHPDLQENSIKLSKDKVVLRINNRTHLKKGDIPFFVSVSASLIEYGGRKVFQDIIRDETERLEYEAELKHLNQVKDQFVSNISHELKTPLASMEIRLHMLSKQPEKIERHTAIIQREVDRLDRLIENLLILSRLDQRRQDIVLTQVDLNNLIQEYCTDRSALAHQNELSLSCEVSPDPLSVYASYDLLGQILSIFLTNAFNYTPSGGDITISTEKTIIDDEMWAGFCVTDTGQGIPPDEQQELFTRFFRGTVGQVSTKSGTGLGLAIAKEIIELHKGKIYVESEGIPNMGATFGIWLPIQTKNYD